MVSPVPNNPLTSETLDLIAEALPLFAIFLRQTDHPSEQELIAALKLEGKKTLHAALALLALQPSPTI